MFFSPHGGGKTNKTTLVIFFMGAKIRSMGGNRGCKNFIVPPWWGENRHFFCIHGGGKTNAMGGKFLAISTFTLVAFFPKICPPWWGENYPLTMRGKFELILGVSFLTNRNDVFSPHHEGKIGLLVGNSRI